MLKGLTAATPTIVNGDIDTNFRTVLENIDQAALCGAQLILFPETVLTGLINNDEYDHDKNLAVPLDSQYILDIREKAKAKGIWVALGFFEIDDGVIYDSTILINDAGQIVLHQQRMSTGWRMPGLPITQYAEGTMLQTTETPWGKTGFLICGDLFDTWEGATEAKLDLLLFPFARCFSAGVTDFEEAWKTEWPEYAKQIQQVSAGLTLGANYISPAEPGDHSGYFGGSFMADKDGNRLSALPLNQAGLLQ